MSRRSQIMQNLGTGGTTAPPRRKQIREALGSSQPRGPGGKSEIRTYPAKPGPGGVLPKVPPMRFPQVPPKRSGGVQEGAPLRAPTPIGKQLQGRLKSGAIDSEQAQKVARQRTMLKNAFGSDWRTKVFGAGGAKGISGPFADAAIRSKRTQALMRARRKTQGGVGPGTAA